MQAIAMSVTIRQYSIAAAPDFSPRTRENIFEGEVRLLRLSRTVAGGGLADATDALQLVVADVSHRAAQALFALIIASCLAARVIQDS